MRIRQILPTALATLVFVVPPVDAQESLLGGWTIVESWGSNPQAGEWRVEDAQPSLYLFLDGYYSIAYVAGDQPRALTPEGAGRTDLSADQAAAVWIPYVSNSGIYEITPSTITFRPMVALWPNFMEGGSAIYTYDVQGDMLRLSRREEDFSWNANLRKVR
jgi:hypothetical protein